MANIGMNFNQAATLLNAIVSQATGAAQITPTNTNEFVSVAQTGLKTGYDPLMNAINQVLTKTIFSSRPYTAKFKGLMMTEARYGNHIRKLQLADNDFEEDDRIKLTEGYSMDQQIVKKPKVLQTNFYGENVFEDHITIFKDQLDVAFTGPDEFSSFISMVMQNMTDRLEKAREELARETLVNLIAGKAKCDAGNVIYLVDEYNKATGGSYSREDLLDLSYYPDFAKWLVGFIKTLAGKMGERSYKYHKNFTIGGTAFNIPRHTPAANMKVYLNSAEVNAFDASVLSSVYNDEYLKGSDYEKVNFWQAIDNPELVLAKPGYVDTDGTQVTSPTTIGLSHVLGLIFDEEAAGYTAVNRWSSPAPFNARGGYTNYWFHETYRYFNDFSENCVVLVFDAAENAVYTPLSITAAKGSDTGETVLTTGYTLKSGESYSVRAVGSTDEDDLVTVTPGEYLPTLTDSTSWADWDGDDPITGQTVNYWIQVAVTSSKGYVVASGNVKAVPK